MTQSSKTLYHQWKDAVTASNLPSSSKLACLIIQGYTTPSDTELQAWPSVATLARQMSCTQDTARKAVRTAERKGFIKRMPRFSDESNRRGNLSNLYELIIPSDDSAELPSNSLAPPLEITCTPSNFEEEPIQKVERVPPNLGGESPEKHAGKYINENTSEDTKHTETKHSIESPRNFSPSPLQSISRKLKNWGYPQDLLDQLSATGKLFLIFQSAEEIQQQALGRHTKRRAHKNYMRELAIAYGLEV